MSDCHACGHKRLLHDSWGCREICGCGVSIIYLTPHPRQPGDDVVEEEIIAEGNKLAVERDRTEESRIKMMQERQIADGIYLL
jgi:hypothetical protein